MTGKDRTKNLLWQVKCEPLSVYVADEVFLFLKKTGLRKGEDYEK